MVSGIKDQGLNPDVLESEDEDEMMKKAIAMSLEELDRVRVVENLWVEVDNEEQEEMRSENEAGGGLSYLIFVIFFTRTKFLENKIYTEKRQFFALNL